MNPDEILSVILPLLKTKKFKEDPKVLDVLIHLYKLKF